MDNVATTEAVAKAEAQKAVDREVAARTELAAAIQNRMSVRNEIAAGSADALSFIDQYVDTTQPHPDPVDASVAAPAPAQEPPVFTSVDSAVLDPASTSGGSSEIAPELTAPGA